MQPESSQMGAARQLRPRKKRKSNTRASEDPVVLPNENFVDHPKKVIRKTSKKRVQGRLAGLVDLPIDVLFEVSGCRPQILSPLLTPQAPRYLGTLSLLIFSS